MPEISRLLEIFAFCTRIWADLGLSGRPYGLRKFNNVVMMLITCWLDVKWQHCWKFVVNVLTERSIIFFNNFSCCFDVDFLGGNNVDPRKESQHWNNITITMSMECCSWITGTTSQQQCCSTIINNVNWMLKNLRPVNRLRSNFIGINIKGRPY